MILNKQIVKDIKKLSSDAQTSCLEGFQDVILNKQIVKDIKKLSSDAQTSCLEGFHATLYHWHPKMISFGWVPSADILAFQFSKI